MIVDGTMLIDSGDGVPGVEDVWGDKSHGQMRSFWRGINANLKCCACN